MCRTGWGFASSLPEEGWGWFLNHRSRRHKCIGGHVGRWRMRSPAPPGGKKISLKLLNDLARGRSRARWMDGEVNGLPGLTPCALGAQGWRHHGTVRPPYFRVAVTLWT